MRAPVLPLSILAFVVLASVVAAAGEAGAAADNAPPAAAAPAPVPIPPHMRPFGPMGPMVIPAADQHPTPHPSPPSPSPPPPSPLPSITNPAPTQSPTASQSPTPRPTSSPPPPPPPHAVFVSIALPGHLTPLLGMAEALLHRGWRVTVVSTDEARAFVVDNVAAWPEISDEQRARIAFASLGDMQAVERGGVGGNASAVLWKTEDVFLRASSLEDFQEGSFVIFEWLADIWRPMYDTLLPLLRDRLGRVSVVVADIMSHAALDAAHTLRLPLILHNADALNVLSPDVLPADDTVPGLFEMISQRDLGLRGRMLYPIARLAARAVVPLRMDARLQPLRATRGLAPRPLLRWADGHLITHSLVAGLEHARALPPLIQMLGPCLPRHWPHLARADALPADLRDWLIAPSSVVAAAASVGSSGSVPTAGLEAATADAATAGPTCLILVNMGTIARLNAAQTAAFYESLLQLLPSATGTGTSSSAGGAAACSAFKIIWKLRAEAQDEHLVRLLPRASDSVDAKNDAKTKSDASDAKSASASATTARRAGGDWLVSRGRVELRVSRWIPSQLALLQLPALRLFVSHCGINSAHEALFFGVPLLCIPLFADQGDMAIRVFDAGAGLIVSKDNITSAALSWALSAIFGADATRFRRSALRLRSLMRMAGGSERGADLVAWVAGGSVEAGANSSSGDGTSHGSRGNAGAAAVWQLPYSWRASWVLAAGLDVAVIYALATMLAWAVCKRVCAFVCARK